MDFMDWDNYFVFNPKNRRIREIVNRVVKGFVRGFVFLFRVQCTNEALTD